LHAGCCSYNILACLCHSLYEGPNIIVRRHERFDNCYVFANLVELDDAQVEYLKYQAAKNAAPNIPFYVCTLTKSYTDKPKLRW
jgi:hypothetical protein